MTGITGNKTKAGLPSGAPPTPSPVATPPAPMLGFIIRSVPIIARETHPVGSPAQAHVRGYLVQQLSTIGLTVSRLQE